MFFFLPQMFNFLLSLPQLFGYVYCPRHRLPQRDPKTNNLIARFPENLNNINFILWICGPLSEKKLSKLCLWIQTINSILVFVVLRMTGF